MKKLFSLIVVLAILGASSGLHANNLWWVYPSIVLAGGIFSGAWGAFVGWDKYKDLDKDKLSMLLEKDEKVRNHIDKSFLYQDRQVKCVKNDDHKWCIRSNNDQATKTEFVPDLDITYKMLLPCSERIPKFYGLYYGIRGALLTLVVLLAKKYLLVP